MSRRAAVLASPIAPAAERTALRRVVGLLDLDVRRFVGAVLAGTAGLGSAVALAAVSAWLIARASQMPPVLDLTVAVVAVRAFGISRGVFRYVERLVSHDVALRGMAALRERVYTTLAAGRPEAVVALRRGDVLARTGADVDAVGDVVVRALLPAVVAAVVGVATVALVACFLPSAALVLAAALLLAGVCSPWLTARAARLAELSALAERAELTAAAMTAVDGAGELQVSGRTPALLAQVKAADARLVAAADAGARPAAGAAAVNLLAMGVAVVGALLLAIPATTAGTLAPVELAVVVLVPLAAFEATAVLPAAAVQLVRSGGAAVRITDLLDAGTATAGLVEARRDEAGPDVPTPDLATPDHATPDLAARGGSALDDHVGRFVRSAGSSPAATLVAEGLACGWPGSPPVLEGVDLAVSPGRSIAVVGPSGVGKSTLLLTLAGLLPGRAGSVRVDGRDPARSSRAQVSRSVVLTSEDAHVFGTSVLENLRVARGDVTDADAADVLTAVGLGDWLERLPEGLDTPLGTDAATISGGERRRLLLARALVSEAPILLLDEPAEHLDPEAADAVVADLLRVAATPERGLVLVTHRLSALAAADEVVLLGVPEGSGTARVVARGTHAQLLGAAPEYAWALLQEETRLDEDRRSDLALAPATSASGGTARSDWPR